MPSISEKLSFSNFPNPITERFTNIEFESPYDQFVELYLCDINGNVIKTLFKGEVKANEKTQISNVDLDDLNSIVGHLKLITNQKVIARKIIKSR